MKVVTTIRLIKNVKPEHEEEATEFHSRKEKIAEICEEMKNFVGQIFDNKDEIEVYLSVEDDQS